MIQAELFDDDDEPGKSRNTDPDTSKEAAASVNATEKERVVLDAICRSGKRGLIAAEFPDWTGLALNTATPRTRPLARKGFIYDSGKRRLSPSGRLQIVWKAVLEEHEEED